MAKTKAELLEEVEKRRAIGREINLSDDATNADIQAALDLDDEDAFSHEDNDDFGDLPKGVEVDELPNPEPALKNADFKGRYKSKADGEVYALAIVKDDPRKRTHKLKNTVHFWEGSEEEFRAQFDKE
jgi:hypothetical protein